MITILIDHNIEGHALRVWDAFQAQGWSDVISLRMLTFDAVDLAFGSSDRDVWRFAQAQSMVLLTANRNMNEADSLEQTIREENVPTSLPVLTLGTPVASLSGSIEKRWHFVLQRLPWNLIATWEWGGFIFPRSTETSPFLLPYGVPHLRKPAAPTEPRPRPTPCGMACWGRHVAHLAHVWFTHIRISCRN